MASNSAIQRAINSGSSLCSSPVPLPSSRPARPLRPWHSTSWSNGYDLETVFGPVWHMMPDCVKPNCYLVLLNLPVDTKSPSRPTISHLSDPLLQSFFGCIDPIISAHVNVVYERFTRYRIQTIIAVGIYELFLVEDAAIDFRQSHLRDSARPHSCFLRRQRSRLASASGVCFLGQSSNETPTAPN